MVLYGRRAFFACARMFFPTGKAFLKQKPANEMIARGREAGRLILPWYVAGAGGPDL